jgi:hypothetical protein
MQKFSRSNTPLPAPEMVRACFVLGQQKQRACAEVDGIIVAIYTPTQPHDWVTENRCSEKRKGMFYVGQIRSIVNSREALSDRQQPLVELASGSCGYFSAD